MKDAKQRNQEATFCIHQTGIDQTKEARQIQHAEYVRKYILVLLLRLRDKENLSGR